MGKWESFLQFTAQGRLVNAPASRGRIISRRKEKRGEEDKVGIVLIEKGRAISSAHGQPPRTWTTRRERVESAERGESSIQNFVRRRDLIEGR